MILTDILRVYLSAPEPWHTHCAAKEMPGGITQVLLHRGRDAVEYTLREQFPEQRTFLVQANVTSVHHGFTAQPVTTEAVEELDVVVISRSETVEIHRFRAVEYVPKLVRIEDEILWTGAVEDAPIGYAETVQKALATARYPTRGFVT